MIAEERVVLARIEGHLSDISVTLGGIDFTLGAIATVLRIYVESQGGQDPLQGTV